MNLMEAVKKKKENLNNDVYVERIINKRFGDL